MNPVFTTPITSELEAQAFFKSLAAEKLLFHPEDDPASVIDSHLGICLFHAGEIEHLRLRVAEAYQFMLDPCEFINNTIIGTGRGRA